MKIPRWIYFYASAFLAETALYSILLAEPLFALKRLGATPLALGLLGTANGAGYAAMAVIAGWLSDRTDRRKWIVAGVVGQALCGLALPFCRRMDMFIAVSAADMFVMGCFWAPLMGLLSESTPPDKISRVAGRYNISWCSGSIAGALLSGWLFERVAPAAPFWAGAVLSAAVAWITLAGRPAARKVVLEPTAHHHRRTGFFRSQAWVLLTCNFFVASLLVYIFPRLAQSLTPSIGPVTISRLHGLRQTGTLAAFALMGATSFWHFRHRTIHVCFALVVLMTAIVALADRSWLFAGPFLVLGASTGMAYGMSAYYSMLSPRAKGSMIGMQEMLLSLGNTLGPIFGGTLINRTQILRLPFWAALAPLTLAWAVCSYFQRRRLRRQARQAVGN